MRLDRALVERGLARSRAEAQGFIAAGAVRVDRNVVTKPSAAVDDTADVKVDATGCPYVSRGGIKLAAALDRFHIATTGKRCLDVGASTGGFTDCLLQHGVSWVVAVDVGHGQMVHELRSDPRVTLREGVNARSLTPSDFRTSFDIVVADLSFISLSLVIPGLARLLIQDGDIIVLVKPQFEVGVAGIGKGGVVRDPAMREQAVNRVILSALESGLSVVDRMTSPIAGGDGNEEFLLHLRRHAPRAEKGIDDGRVPL